MEEERLRLDVVNDLGGGWMTPGDGSELAMDESKLKQSSSNGLTWVEGEEELPPSLMLERLLCFRPARFVATYSQAMPRFAQREQVGFSLWHFNLEAAQARQLSRSLGTEGAAVRRPEVEEDEAVASAILCGVE